MIFISDSITSRKVRKSKDYDTGDLIVQEFKAQTSFEAFVISLFDPLYFTYRRLKQERVLAGRMQGAEIQPDLEFEFNHKGVRSKFAVQCLFREGDGRHDVKLFSPERLQIYRHFEAENDTPLYYVIGIGGSPEDPRELYLVPCSAVKGELISKGQLAPYRKSGMFYYNANLNQLR
jgi:hypothetical protein